MKARERRYGLSDDAFQRMHADQNGACGICRTALTPDRVVVDHNHSTGTVRGLLCRTCNTGIGLLNDDPETLIAAAEYLKQRGYYGQSNKG